MGMGYGANNVMIVREKKMKEMQLPEYNKFMEWFDDEDENEDELSFDEIASSLAYEDTIPDNILKLYIELQKAFESKVGLSLSLGYHDRDNAGDRYDDVDGGFWCLDGVFVLSEAAKKFKGNFEAAYFVTFG